MKWDLTNLKRYTIILGDARQNEMLFPLKGGHCMKGKPVFVAVLALAIAGLVLSVVSYSAADVAVNRTIQERLMAQAKDWRIIVDA